MSTIKLRTLVLSNNYMPLSLFPLSTVPAQDAISRYLNNSCDVVFWYDRPILTASRTDLYWPSVIVNRNSKSFRNNVRLKKDTLYYRDHCVCYWCNEKITINTMTYDHMIPRSKGGSHSWNNVVASCKSCNEKKSDSMPVGQWAPKKYKPYAPSFVQLLEIRGKYPIEVHDKNWINFLPHFASENVIIKEPISFGNWRDDDQVVDSEEENNVILFRKKKKKRG